jgi:AraC-like DNA-binding protein
MLRFERIPVPPHLGEHLGPVLRLSGDGMDADDWLLPDVSAASIAIQAGTPSLLGVSGDLSPMPARGVAGRLSGPRLLRHEGAIDAIVIELPAACACLLGVPPRELTDVVAPLADVAPRLDRELARFAEEYAEGRTTIADLALRVAAHVRPCCDRVARRAASRLVRDAGAPVDRLAADLGLSRRQLERRFGGSVGLSPRAFKRVARFSRAVRLAGTPRPASWAEIAAEAGYVDQPHLVRDFRSLAGGTPTAVFSDDWYRDIAA